MKTRGFLLVALMPQEFDGFCRNGKVFFGEASIANRSYFAADSLVADTIYDDRKARFPGVSGDPEEEPTRTP